MANKGSTEKLDPQPDKRDRLKVSDCIVVHPSGMKTALRGSIVGNFMEWYDFGIYGYLAVTMTQVFTAGMDESAGLLVTLLGFAVSFLVRPLGGMILGPLGDRIGRQRVLFMTMAIMAAATALIGLLPTASQVGLWVIAPLYLLKMLQGFSTGGEYAGATTYVSEFSPDKARGYWSSWLDVGSYMGFAAGAVVVAITTISVGEENMVTWGWRIPFLTAIPLGAIAVYLRMKLPETPSFEAAEEEGEIANPDPQDRFARHNIAGIIRLFWREILIGMALVAGSMTISYTLTSYMPTYLEKTKEIGMSNLEAAMATVPVLVAISFSLPFIGKLSDRIGRRPIFGMACVSTLVLTLPAFWMMHSGETWQVYVALFLVGIPTALYLAMGASALPALFPTASRFGAMGITFNVAVSLFGGTSALISQALVDLTGNSYMPAFYIMFFSVLAGLAVIPMRESAKRPLLGSYPTVSTEEEARELVAGQDTNPYLEHEYMPRVHHERAITK